jgi:hypothetical protein
VGVTEAVGLLVAVGDGLGLGVFVAVGCGVGVAGGASVALAVPVGVCVRSAVTPAAWGVAYSTVAGAEMAADWQPLAGQASHKKEISRKSLLPFNSFSVARP